MRRRKYLGAEVEGRFSPHMIYDSRGILIVGSPQCELADAKLMFQVSCRAKLGNRVSHDDLLKIRDKLASSLVNPDDKKSFSRYVNYFNSF